MKYENSKYENAKYANEDETAISVDIDSKSSWVPVSIDNADYRAMLEQEITISDYVVPQMDMDEFRSYRNAELNRIDTVVANAQRWDTFTTSQKADVAARKQSLKDLPTSVNLTGVAAGDKAAADALFATTPFLP